MRDHCLYQAGLTDINKVVWPLINVTTVIGCTYRGLQHVVPGLAPCATDLADIATSCMLILDGKYRGQHRSLDLYRGGEMEVTSVANEVHEQIFRIL